ncbi:MAG: glycosyltransferase [Solirubrobacteraceae bacterium]|nr:glycosyltransferase [Solirubrobacteraceae bacterium]
MRILALSPEFPDPHGNGGEQRLFQILSRLPAKGIDLSVLAPGRSAAVERSTPLLEESGIRVHAALRPSSRFVEVANAVRLDLSLGRRLATSSWLSWQAQVYEANFRGQVTSLLCDGRWSGVILEHDWALSWTQFIPKRVPIAATFHNITPQLISDRAERLVGPHAVLARRHARIAQREIRSAIHRLSHGFACSREDAHRLHTRFDIPMSVVPNGTDINRFSGVPTYGSCFGRMVFTGTLSYGPNAEAIWWFCTTVLPLIQEQVPGASIDIVGGGASKRTLSLGRLPGVRILGRVPDLQPHLTQAGVAVVPLRSGGGTKLKVIEAAAASRAIVTTSVGNAGLEFRADEHLVIADTPEAFSAACVRLLRNPHEARELGVRAQKLASAQYDWDTVAESQAQAIHHWLTAPSASHRDD